MAIRKNSDRFYIIRHRFPILVFALLLVSPVILFAFQNIKQRELASQAENINLVSAIESAKIRTKELEAEVAKLGAEDTRVANQKLRQEMAELVSIYRSSFTLYEDILRLREQTGSRVAPLEKLFAILINSLSKNDTATSKATIKSLADEIAKERGRLAALISVVTIPANVVERAAPPGSGYSRQKVTVDNLGSYLVDIIAADLGSTKVIVDTASNGTCVNDCPVLPLATYVSRSGAYAGINGSYFCPASYPSCAGKTNSFDLLVMNKNKVYMNSDNNVYSNNPGVVFSGGSVRFLSAVSGWGRDTGIDGMISNFPLTVSGGNVAFGGNDDPKQGSRGSRSFVANKGNTVYIGVIHGVTVAESARVLAKMGMENALNLDSGGSTALWSGGYKVGPGRDLPNVVLFVKK